MAPKQPARAVTRPSPQGRARDARKWCDVSAPRGLPLVQSRTTRRRRGPGLPARMPGGVTSLPGSRPEATIATNRSHGMSLELVPPLFLRAGVFRLGSAWL
ncbi:hypothetical protein RAJCM14343_2892 [Rhodococcus aetherivorans]|uniref:Uncharacterized protein n=1 Tax=Rhodococcus aetherivorans TaxID=191292 RepID=A0ABQ0YM40_9NOCA|nr:hypothetical protein RAJCM14343_2892 [Rhodococcus aetherivorans]